MNKVYNSQNEIASKMRDFLLKCNPNIRKTQLKIIPYIVLGMILSESSVASDIAKSLKDDFSLIQHESVIRRIKRLFKNKLFDPYKFYDDIIRYIISNYKPKHDDKRIHLTFDHMFSHDNYTVFMITMRIGKQGIPLWFRCFKDKDDSNAFDENLLKEGISYVSSLFDSSYNLIFLADRWFNSTTLMQHIESLGHTYCIRLKRNIKVFVHDKKENNKVWKSLNELKSYKYHSKSFNDILLTDNSYKTNIVISKSDGVSEPWIIVTNGSTQRAIKDYGYRFGSIESVFKNQKSNGFYIESVVKADLDYFSSGFYIESVVKADLDYFSSMYTLVCFSTLFLTILGADYSKNSSCYKNVKITTHKCFIENGKRVKKRVLSLFNTGLTLFNLAFNSLKYVRLSFSFTLYDI